MTAAAEPNVATEAPPRPGAARFLRPALGLLLPVGLAVIWEFAVRAGFSDGRLVPPPSRIYETFVELWRPGELQRHATATILRVAAGFAVGVTAGTLIGATASVSTFFEWMHENAPQYLQ